MRNIARYFKHVFLFNLWCGIKYILPDKNIQNLKKMKNTATRDRCFIAATGPSLNIKDLDNLKDEITFGVNGIFLTYGKTEWRPTHYVCTDDSYFFDMYNEYELKDFCMAKQDAFLNIKNKNLHIDNETHYLRFSRWNRSTDFKKVKFHKNIAAGMYAFGTVTNVAIAIAMYMGYKKIYLIGCDCSNLNRHIVNDVSDASKNNDKAKEIAQTQIKGYKAMKEIAEKNNVEIYNATRGGELEVFIRVDFDKIIRGGM